MEDRQESGPVQVCHGRLGFGRDSMQGYVIEELQEREREALLEGK